MMKLSSALRILLLTVACLTSTGCQWLRNLTQFPPVRPPVITEDRPTLDQVSNIVNHNSSRIVSLRSSGASISSNQMPISLNADLAMRRDRRLRLKAGTTLTGTEVDLGSNDDLFWMWIKAAEPKALYYCRHEQYGQSAARRILPLPPEAIIEAFGLARIDPRDQHTGPEPVGKERLRITSMKQTSAGPLMKVTVVDARYGDVIEQHLYDGNQQLIASALTQDFRGYDLQAGERVFLPHTVQLVFPATDMTLTVSVDEYYVNSLSADPMPMWQMPEFPGYPVVNLADPRMQMIPRAGQPAADFQQGGGEYNVQYEQFRETQRATYPGQSGTQGSGAWSLPQQGAGFQPAGFAGGSSMASDADQASFDASSQAVSPYSQQSSPSRPSPQQQTSPVEPRPGEVSPYAAAAAALEQQRETIVSPPSGFGSGLWR